MSAFGNLGRVRFFLLSSLVNARALSNLSHSLEGLPRLFPKRSSLNQIVVVGGNIGADSGYYCSKSEVEQIDYNLSWVRELSKSAYNFLLEDDSETTAAYIAWFGANNATRNTADSIRRNIYDSIYEIGDKTESYVADIDYEGNALVIGCPSLYTWPDCKGTRAISDTNSQYVKLCPAYFREHYNYEATFSRWRQTRDRDITGAETILHEMTHIAGVVGLSWATDDIGYEPGRCLLLDDDEMIKNADNFMLFALEVRANPNNAAKQVDMDSDEPKYKIARRFSTRM
ncbi:zincin [Colletotrichum eremochloae]|nr:zincin [Colletotrichum eremochloae]